MPEVMQVMQRAMGTPVAPVVGVLRVILIVGVLQVM